MAAFQRTFADDMPADSVIEKNHSRLNSFMVVRMCTRTPQSASPQRQRLPLGA
jgi:hypothetical protein